MTSRTILLVEDNPDDAELMRMAMRKTGVKNPLRVVTDGAAALDYLFGGRNIPNRTADERPVLILLDLNLPKIGGIEVLRRIRAEGPAKHTPVVVLTSSREERDLAACYAACVNSYIRKPVDFDEFQKAVRHIVAYWLDLNEPPPAAVPN